MVQWDAETGRRIRDLTADGINVVKTIAVSEDGRYIAMGGFCGAQVWEASSGHRVGGVLPHGNTVASLAFGADHKVLLTVSGDRSAQRWSLPDGRPLGAPLQHQAGVANADYSANGRFLATGQEDGLIRVWRLPAGDPDVHRLAYSVDGAMAGSMALKLSFDRRYAVAAPDVTDVSGGEEEGSPLRQTRGL